LKGFERVTLPAHGKKTVHMTLGKQELRYWSAAKRDWVEDVAAFDVWVGESAEASLHSSFEVTM
jgi:beta-glucosidase